MAKKIDPNGPLAATALRLAAEMLQERYEAVPLKSAEDIAARVQMIGVLAESLIRSFLVSVEKSPMKKQD